MMVYGVADLRGFTVDRFFGRPPGVAGVRQSVFAQYILGDRL